jgi:hypothetical protein
MSEFDDDNYVANDFYSLVGDAQLKELREVEKQREIEREKMKQLAEESQSKSMTLMQIAGLRSQKEIDALSLEKNEAEEKRLKDEDTKRKEQEHARLVNQFPPPDLKHNS